MGDTGLEHTTNFQQKTVLLEQRAAKSNALDARLQAVINAWSDLSDDVKDEMIAMVNAAQRGSESQG